MRLVHTVFLLALGASPALAQTGPVIVIPGRPDVPIVENGVDISWAVVESELGLARPGVLTPTVIYRPPPPVIVPVYVSHHPGFFPSSGKTPGYGRLEEVPSPDQPPPKPAQSYRKSWTSNSANTPADLPPTYNQTYPMYISPIIAPSFNGRSHNPWGNGPMPVPGQPNGGPAMPGMGNRSFNAAPGAPPPGGPMPGMGSNSFNGAPGVPPGGPMPGMGSNSFNGAPGAPPGGPMPGQGE